MIAIRTALVSGAATLLLSLAACGETADDGATSGEDSTMPTADDRAGGSTPRDEAIRAAPDANTAEASADGADSLPEGDECGASKVAQFVTQEATPAVRARVSAEVGHDRIRWIGPDTAVTMDFSPNRLNVLLNDEDVITGARCG